MRADASRRRRYESIAFRYIAANEQPDHDSLCTFRKRFLNEIEALFVQVLCIARQMKLLKLGTIALDGTKVHANASRHSALSYGHAHKIEAQLEAEVKDMLARAEAADQEPLPEGLSIPAELARREQRLAAIRQAKAQIEARAAERDAQDKAEFEAKTKAREDKSSTHRQEARRQAARTAQCRCAPHRPDQSHRCRFAHHARQGQGL